ncbi:MAG: FIST C-terminal domain-containing protein [Chitinophagaceae bacterium]|nr:FIST C-terminal domain-containing protein [Chitinophagaceae bacterium]MCA6452800.1 FIST C-terminal domain-containing protein [Chitinophagaceae bacterium]MCA6455222.1 FIST C-terminal domain-containing protein [Chitinophagaceae bacterium]MCA6458396.1 FIST C-terminal domain-containing protein [Chitinophagaceae bacterium]MCA6465419.1 FIST C-terminal domain-containing protein [Chitinophagaceae bacterium]
MRTIQQYYAGNQWHGPDDPDHIDSTTCQLVLVFGSGALVTRKDLFSHIRSQYPNAEIISCSTAGEILEDTALDNSLTVTAIQFEKTQVRTAQVQVNRNSCSVETGRLLMKQLDADDLVSIFVLSESSFINGDELVRGFNENNPRQIPVTGGLAGDAERFQKTQVGLNGVATEGTVVAIGLYGQHLRVTHSSFGGWEEFGRERIITRSENNILYEIDNRNALDLYREYLGPYAEELPGAALFFPLSMQVDKSGYSLVRTILSINEENKNMVFAGNLPEGSKVRLMKANFDKIINAASEAATGVLASGIRKTPELAILVSCVGRKRILQERTAEEIRAARKTLGPACTITGFYSYGEIAPFGQNTDCELHNQTMTITTLTEL